MEIPPEVLAKATALKICCSFQPCPNEASGELTVDDNGEEMQLPICEQHLKQIM